jgi:hypothetical protein
MLAPDIDAPVFHGAEPRPVAPGMLWDHAPAKAILRSVLPAVVILAVVAAAALLVTRAAPDQPPSQPWVVRFEGIVAGGTGEDAARWVRIGGGSGLDFPSLLAGGWRRRARGGRR